MDAIAWLKAAGTVLGVSMAPVLELKAAIPLGLAMGLPLWETFFVALIGSAIPVPFILLFLRPLIALMKRAPLFHRLASWAEARTHRKASGFLQRYRKYQLLGLFIFVAIPLPTTGVWTGSGIAALLDIRIKYALPVILAGNAVAGLLMLLFGQIVIL